nr:E3 ubiquitin-protein ligase CCNB1IP1 homolog isoform X3 [Physcomitrium patens]|eukprot:XP_024382544.1 E3 ubiquitin-protein ligase CCNB1IP1 homolog isoform X3 [Physcomitrella patens]
MKCNACWKNLEGRAVATTCGHIFCTEDAQKILSSVDANCPLCEQTLSKSKVKAVDMSPTDEWINMDVEVQLSVNKALHFRQKCEQMQGAYAQKMRQVEEAYTAKLQQVHSGYQKAMKKIQAMDHEKEVMLKDKKEIQEKYTEKSRQKRKLEEMYDALRKEYELLRRSIASSTPDNTAVVQRPNPYSFAPNFNGLDDIRHQSSGLSDMAPNTPAVTPNFWRNSCPEAQLCSFDLPNLQQSSRNQRQATGNSLPRPFSAGSPTMFNASVHSQFATSAGAQPSDTFRNLLRSPGTRRSQGLMRGL